MASTTFTTPLMNLILPIPGQEPGPTWANDLNTALEALDSHDHSTGKGSPIPAGSININADLSFAGNNATTLKSARFVAQLAALTGPNDKACLYSINGDLYYNNASGTSIQVTSGSSIAGTPGTISGLVNPAALSYSNVTTTFTFTQAAAQTAKIACGDLSISDTSAASTNPITIKSPVGLGAAYTFTLPTALPGTGVKILTVDNTGAMGLTYDVDATTLEVASSVIRIKDTGVTGAKLNPNVVDNITLQLSSAVLSVKALGVGTAQLANGAVTQAKRAALPYVMSGSSGTYSTASGSPTTVLTTPSLTCTGRPVEVFLQSSGSGAKSYIYTDGGGGTGNAYVNFYRDGSAIASFMIGASNPANPCFRVLDTGAAAGNHTYTLVVNTDSGGTIWVNNVVLVAEEQ